MNTIQYYSTTKNLGITFGTTDSKNSDKPILDYYSYCDSNYTGDIDTRYSTTGYIYFIAGSSISWKTVCQHTVTLSSTEAEYYTLTEAAKEAIWYQTFLDKLKYTGPDIYLTVIYRDNTGLLDLAENPAYYSCAKYIQIRIYYIREQVSNRSIELSYVPSTDIAANSFTKLLPGLKHQKFLDQLGLQSWK